MRTIATVVAELGLASMAMGATIHVPRDRPTIQLGLDAASPGDTVIVACGTYYEHDIELQSGVVLQSETADPACAAVDGQNAGWIFRGLELSSSTVIRGFTITHGRSIGGGAMGASGSLLVDHCVFNENTADNGGGAFTGTGSRTGSPTITNCVFNRNTALIGGAVSFSHAIARIEGCLFVDNSASYGGAIAIWDLTVPGTNNPLRLSTMIDHCTFTRNFGAPYGVLFLESYVDVTNCTIVDNVFGAVFAGTFSTTLHNCIIAFNSAQAIQCSIPPGTIEVSCTDIFSNLGGNWIGCVFGQSNVNGNIEADPQFCDRENDDLRLMSSSPCAPGNSPPGCALIGAHPVGCTATTLEPTSWGRIKALFR